MNDDEGVEVLDLRALDDDGLPDVQIVDVLMLHGEATLKAVRKTRRIDDGACLDDAHLLHLPHIMSSFLSYFIMKPNQRKYALIEAQGELTP